MMTTQKISHRFVVCVSYDGCEDLSPWKLYRLLRDKTAEAEGFLRVVDESGEDYLYPARRFIVVPFSPKVERKLLTGGRKSKSSKVLAK